MVSRVRQNFHNNSEAGINKQINMELYASQTYLSLSSYFDRDDVALPGFSKFFLKASHEEREHAEKLIKYQNSRGGRVVFQDVKRPEKDEWGTAAEAVETALGLEKAVNQSLLDLHAVADNHNDYQFADFLEGEYLKEQVEGIKELGDLLTKLKRAGPGLGEHIIDKELQ